MNRLNIIILLISLFFAGCAKHRPISCLKSLEPTATVNEIIIVESCGYDFDILEWAVEGGGETILGGGGYCDKVIRLSFSSAGEKIVKVTAWQFKKRPSTCDESAGRQAGKKDVTKFHITVQ